MRRPSTSRPRRHTLSSILPFMPAEMDEYVMFGISTSCWRRKMLGASVGKTRSLRCSRVVNVPVLDGATMALTSRGRASLPLLLPAVGVFMGLFPPMAGLFNESLRFHQPGSIGASENAPFTLANYAELPTPSFAGFFFETLRISLLASLAGFFCPPSRWPIGPPGASRRAGGRSRWVYSSLRRFSVCWCGPMPGTHLRRDGSIATAPTVARYLAQ